MNAPCDHTVWLHGGEAACQHRVIPPRAPRRIVLLGPPGVGKGTQAGLLSAALGGCYLSTNDIFDAVRPDAPHPPGPALRVALEYSRSGLTVPDDALLGVISERGRCFTCGGGIILDGYPRTVRQAEALDLLLKTNGLALDIAVRYELPVAQILPRLLGRRICPACQQVYHIKENPPLTPGVCDRCQTHLEQRRHDRIDSIRMIQGTHAMKEQPLINYYQLRGLLVTIPAHGTPQEVFMRTIDQFRQVIDRQQLLSLAGRKPIPGGL